MTASTTAACKAKARLHQQEIAGDIQNALDLYPDDVVSRSMGASGADIMLSKIAQERFPFAVEAKRCEKLSLPKWWKQTEQNAIKEGLVPMLIYRQNNTENMVVMKWKDFLEVVKDD